MAASNVQPGLNDLVQDDAIATAAEHYLDCRRQLGSLLILKRPSRHDVDRAKLMEEEAYNDLLGVCRRFLDKLANEATVVSIVAHTAIRDAEDRNDDE